MQPAAGETRKTSGVPEHRLPGQPAPADAAWAEDLQDEAWESAGRSTDANGDGVTASFLLIKNLLFWGSMAVVLAAAGVSVAILF
ncbi:Uncharacterised protein [Pannonibacter phragmitetus]|uniref:Uncharacterized protein n=1 Tax=Pannonibacter phragmitetus TaxID=121719 RepID=A0A378ZYQ9_9HYPH|nr:hypothetical protein [Pannonibacter phragmitetus]SUB02277.1 Uncharacterised protein [Pannonibacter phragmitetus]